MKNSKILIINDVSQRNTLAQSRCYKKNLIQNLFRKAFIYICKTVTHVTPYKESRAQDNLSIYQVNIVLFQLFFCVTVLLVLHH